jgi:hypothetical protein
MKTFHYFSLIIMILSAFATAKAIAEPVTANPSKNKILSKIHLVQNLDEANLLKVILTMRGRGFDISTKPVFSESNSALLITHVEATESNPAHFQVEPMVKEENRIPRSLNVQYSNTSEVESLLSLLPTPSDFNLTSLGQNN